MPKKCLVFVVLIFSFQSLSFSQTSDGDTYDSDTAHINKLINQCENIIYINPDSSSILGDSILILSQNINYDYGLYKAYNLQGVILWMKSDLDNAVIKYKTALKYTESSIDPRQEASVLSNIALVYSFAYNSDSAIVYFDKTIEFSKTNNVIDIYNKALFDLANFYIGKDNYTEAAKNLISVREELEVNPDSVLLIYVYSGFGVLYSNVNEFDLALYNYKKSIEIDEDVSRVNNIASNYLNIGELFFRSKNLTDSAVYYYNKAVNAALPYNKKAFEMATKINYANILMENLQIDSAGKYYEEVFKDSLLKYYPDRKAAVLVNLGYYNLEKNNLIEAKKYLELGYNMCKELGILDFEKNALESLTRLAELNSDFQLSLKYYKLYSEVTDSLNTINASLEIAKLEFKKYSDQQQQNNELLKKENTLRTRLNWIAIIAIFILLSLLYILYRNRHKIKKLLNQLSHKNNELVILNEELNVTNETLNDQQEQLKALSITKDKFFSILGHDLKSPFNSLLGLLSLLSNDWGIMDDVKKHDFINSLYSSSLKTYNLLEDILNWGKAQQGFIKQEPQKFNLLEELIAVKDLFTVQLASKEIKLTIDVSSETILFADKRLLVQIIQNLLNNAIKYSYRGGSVLIDAKTMNNKIEICLSDKGIGIPEEKLSKIFDLDSDFNREGTENESSTGMGLILSIEYAKLMNAKLTVNSSEGEGSTFCLIIPTHNIQQ